jgi:hypothetical protein
VDVPDAPESPNPFLDNQNASLCPKAVSAEIPQAGLVGNFKKPRPGGSAGSSKRKKIGHIDSPSESSYIRGFEDDLVFSLPIEVCSNDGILIAIL